MTLEWTHETVPYWDEEKARIVGGADPGSFPHRFEPGQPGDVLPGDWWRVEEGGRVIGYGWMDVTWGDAEMLLVVEPAARNRGVGTEILDRLENEARARGLNYLYNEVNENHPQRDTVVAWLRKRSFLAGDNGTLLRAVLGTAKTQAI